MIGRRGNIVAGLALSDLVHEWVLSLCLVFAFAAIATPLLLLMGLKHGTISTLRHKLVQDPTYREIRPVRTQEYPSNWFDTVARRDEIAFLIPTILAASSIVSIVHPRTNAAKIYDLVATGPGDPLILENEGEIPQGDQCVLTTAAAAELGITAGDSIKVQTTRSSRGRREYGEVSMQVVSVLSPRASGLQRIYAPLPFVLDVECYKEGMAVPSRGWPGGSRRPYFSYDGIIVVLPRQLTPVEESGLMINTGLSTIEKLSSEDFTQKAGFPLPGHLNPYKLSTYNDSLNFSSIKALKNKLRGREAILIPYADSIRLKTTETAEFSVFGLSISSSQARKMGLSGIPWNKLEQSPSNEKLLQILMPTEMPAGRRMTVTVDEADGSFSFPLVCKGPTFGDYPIVPAELIGILRTARQRKIIYEEKLGGFELSRTGFRGFRLYTHTIDDVVPMVRELQKQGIETFAQVESIERIRILDRGLRNIFLLVAVVGIGGGIAALIASLYAAVERKQQALSVMRLIGLSRLNVFLFPVYQGAMLAAMSMIAAMVAYFFLGDIINHIFAGDLEMGENICRLPSSYLIIATVAAVLVALMSSLVAAWRTTVIDPADALRYE
jgi:putative ABC transport system permease protein